jgi:hypothetical protein
MEDLKFNNPEDWYEIQPKLRKICQDFKIFHRDYQRIINNIEEKIRDVSRMDVEIRRRPTPELVKIRKKKVKDINDIIRILTKSIVMATLSKR